MNEETLNFIGYQLERIADALEKANEVQVYSEERAPIMDLKMPVMPEVAKKEVEYKPHNEIGKGPVMAKTCGQEVCRCLRNDGSCAAHHPEFCPKCKKLNRI